MPITIGIDSREFRRDVIKKDSTSGHFKSALGIAVEVWNYGSFRLKYIEVIKSIFEDMKLDQNYTYYCTHDLINFPEKEKFLDLFLEKISPHIHKLCIFYSLFSQKRLAEIKVYGRLSRRRGIKLAKPTRNISQITDNVNSCFPSICAWRLSKYFDEGAVDFHLDSHGGHVFDAYEELEQKKFRRLVFPSGDCCNPVISTADLIIDILDSRLMKNDLFLVGKNIRPTLPEFGDNTFVYPLKNINLSSIVPVDNVPINTNSCLPHPIYWVFKGDSLVNSQDLKRSEGFRNLVDYVAGHHGIVKLFETQKDIDYFKEGDYGVYLNSRGEETIETFKKIRKRFTPMKFDLMLPETDKK
ncbi:MAG: hypothetical protein L6243_01765 [Candidatus Altiarchaeales archaeon]|nr:hypothetical protein [Candidatus Altiarchaeota archaeon]MBU4341850.1 hypothetical protein [Candidatus Altiarchaeota archaeon]MCG2782296.1 hypothetical protein [Candidatus Altiarchaeales archaeon]